MEIYKIAYFQIVAFFAVVTIMDYRKDEVKTSKTDDVISSATAADQPFQSDPVLAPYSVQSVVFG